MRWRWALGAAGALALVSSTARIGARADTEVTAGAGDYYAACAQWVATDGTGYTVSLCSGLFLGGGYDTTSSPTSGLPGAIVQWFNYCGTRSACTPYFKQARVSPTDVSFDPLGRSASVATAVSGCQLSFQLQSQPAGPTDGFYPWPGAAAWPSEPSAGASAWVIRALLASGSGSVCNEPVAQGLTSQAEIVRATGAGAGIQTTGSSLLPSPGPPTWQIAGRVTDQAGTPVSGAVISDGHASTTTGADGSYQLTDHSISLANDVLAYADGYVPVDRDVTIIDAQQRVNFVLKPNS